MLSDLNKELHSPFSGDGDNSPNMRGSYSPGKSFGDRTHTQTNFYFKQDKEKMDAAAERLIHSVNAVTDLLKANTKLRDNIEKV